MKKLIAVIFVLLGGIVHTPVSSMGHLLRGSSQQPPPPEYYQFAPPNGGSGGQYNDGNWHNAMTTRMVWGGIGLIGGAGLGGAAIWKFWEQGEEARRVLLEGTWKKKLKDAASAGEKRERGIADTLKEERDKQRDAARRWEKTLTGKQDVISDLERQLSAKRTEAMSGSVARDNHHQQQIESARQQGKGDTKKLQADLLRVKAELKESRQSAKQVKKLHLLEMGKQKEELMPFAKLLSAIMVCHGSDPAKWLRKYVEAGVTPPQDGDWVTALTPHVRLMLAHKEFDGVMKKDRKKGKKKKKKGAVEEDDDGAWSDWEGAISQQRGHRRQASRASLPEVVGGLTQEQVEELRTDDEEESLDDELIPERGPSSSPQSQEDSRTLGQMMSDIENAGYDWDERVTSPTPGQAFGQYSDYEEDEEED